MDKHFFLERLIIKRPSVFTQYNYEYLPDKFLATDYITIECYRHGPFAQRADSHLYGSGCIICNKEARKLSREEFIRKAREVHGDKYDYSKVKYNGNKRPVEIICKKHGSFWKKPNAHISSSSGCSYCWESTGEKLTAVCLDKYNIKYIRQYKISPYKYRYDFFLT